MSLKSKLAILVGKTALITLKLLKRSASSYPGQLALKIDPTVLKDLAASYETVIVTGTNGKTLTTALTTQVLAQQYDNILTNSSGSNMTQGVVSAFLGHKRSQKQNVAVLEIDEAYLTQMSEYLKPKAIVMTNIFRDQLDRFGEIYTIHKKIVDGVLKTPETTLVLNGDAPIFNSVNLPNPKIFFGFNHQEEHDQSAPSNTDNIICPHCEKILRYKQLTYANLGQYYCPNCEFKRPHLDYAVTNIEKLSLEKSVFSIDKQPFTIPVAGLYNIYNALAAYSVGRLFNIPITDIQNGVGQLERVFGRQEIINVENKNVLINLIKNPVGLNQVLDLLKLQEGDCSMFTILNDNYADGQDVSWIWDGQFEALRELDIKQLVVGGIRHPEMLLRLEVAGFNKENITVATTMEDIVAQIKQSPSQTVNILATYTAMLELRKTLFSQGYVKGELK